VRINICGSLKIEPVNIIEKRRYLLWIIPTLLIIVCSLCYFGATTYFDRNRPLPEEIFSRYLSYSDYTKLVENAENIRADELSMGQGVYLRFEVDKDLVIEFLEHEKDNSVSLHYPYETVVCEEFYEAYADWADGWSGYKWWRPREITSPECYVTRGCEYFLFDEHSKITYYFFLPDFLGKDFLCVEEN
jgi:hypothetical protein